MSGQNGERVNFKATHQGPASMERFSAFSATSSTQELHSVL